MTYCKNCGNILEDGTKFCPQCGAEVSGTRCCARCGNEFNGMEKFCSQCGSSLDNVSSNSIIIEENETATNGFKRYLPYVIGTIVLIVVCGGWWLLRNKESSESFETTLVSFKKVAPSDNLDVEAEINIDFPKKGNPNLIKNITSLLLDALANDFKNNEEWLSPHYDGDISDGKAIVDFFGNEKIKELQKQGIGYAKISILKTYETDKMVSFTIDFAGNNGGVGLGTKYGMSFNKEDGTTIQVIKDPNDSNFKNYLIAKILKYLKANDSYDSYVESELREHPFPEKAPYLTKDGVCFIYQKYEIGSGPLGEVELTIPYNSIKPYINEVIISLENIDTNIEYDETDDDPLLKDSNDEMEYEEESNYNQSVDVSSILNECQAEITSIQREIESTCSTFAILASDDDIDMMKYGRMKITFINGVNDWVKEANKAFDKCANDLKMAGVKDAESAVNQEKRQFNIAINELKSRTLQQVEMSY